MHANDVKVRGYHLDGFGHVNNARYLEFLEEARWAVFDEKLDLESLARDGFVFTVVNININYRLPAFLHDTLTVETRVKEWRRRSTVLHQQVTNRASGQTVADADITFVMVDVKTQKAAPVEGDLRQRLNQVLAD